MPIIKRKQTVENYHASVKKLAEQEFIRCAVDIIHFFKKYAKIQHPKRGKILFDLYPFQEDTLRAFIDNRFNIILKSRQMGISTLVAAYALHCMLFNDDFRILVIATKQEVAKNLVEKVQMMYKFLPDFLKQGISIVNNNKLSISFSNGSSIKAVASSPDAARSEALSLLIIDECAFIPDIDDIWASAQMTLATGGNAIVLSTPNGTNKFYELWQRADAGDVEDGLDKFNPIKLPWYLHPERDTKWRAQQDVLLGKRLASQECFTGETLIHTSNGLRRIDNVNVGDLVLTHLGEFKPVVRLYKHVSNDLYEVNTMANNVPINVTGNHPILVKDKGWTAVTDIDTFDYVAIFPTRAIDIIDRSVVIDLYNEMIPKYFKKKSNAVDEFYVNDRRHKRIHKRFVNSDYDLGYIVGLYLAEGSGDRLRKTFSFNYETELNGWVSELIDKLNTKFGICKTSIRTTRTPKSGQLDVASEIFCWVIDKLVIGKTCYSKCLSPYSWAISNKQYLSGILDGYMSGDGMIKNRYNVQSSTRSELLCNDIKYICNVIGFPYNRRNIRIASNLERFDFGKPYVDSHDAHFLFLHNTKGCEGKLISSAKQSMVVYGKKRNYFIDDNYVYTKVSIKKIQKTDTVYNLEVQDHNSYITDHFVVHNCDAEFLTSGHTVLDPDDIKWYRENTVTEPLEKRGIGGDIWIWKYPDYNKSYVTTADPSRGDGEDYSAFKIFEVETMEMVVEFKGKVDTQTLGHMLVAISTEYNHALLVIDNKNIGWSTVQVAIDSKYNNLYYSYRHDPYLDEAIHLMKGYDLKNKEDMVPGFTISSKIRPVLISKFEQYLREHGPVIRSARSVAEYLVFVWHNGKAQAQKGYNDDLVMCDCMFFYVRDTALRLRQMGIELVRTSIQAIHKPVFKQKPAGADRWSINVNGQYESLKWLL